MGSEGLGLRQPAQDTAECVVCFEDLASVGGAVPLPCRCSAPYCRDCWDRALNAKFEQTQMAQCPTCRAAMRVDFDSESGQLKFTSQGSGVEAQRDPLMRVRLQEQARPRQVQLLRQHGARLTEAAGSPGPECVCGCRMVRSSVHDRVLAWVAQCFRIPLEDAKANANALEATAKFVDGTWQAPLTCDICQCLNGPSRMDTSGSVWSCTAGTTTILHANSFDVCEGCYERYVRNQPVE